MATVVNNPGDSSGSAGWAVAVIILIAVLALGYFAWSRTGAAPAADTLDVNVTVPAMEGGSMTPEGN